ncbi:MAG: divergent polysaccharide deacetylase family protein [Campylobacter lanienae]|uniref:divergent polysaccharide deacetylase family protein n=1 Tax=Campylobacter lanienae TaxID=75658 RepID=UPI0024330D85|nr:divergent polysaccharide deacetylase family protein [Campylobacter lanienae]MCI7364910.1 divergent polysaccharide deacetylase family protein [Campylobacter lanienae]
MAKRSKNSTSNNEVLVYLGIFLSIGIIIVVVYLMLNSKSSQKQAFEPKAIEKIDRYFADKTRDYSILDTAQNATQIEQNVTKNIIQIDENITQIDRLKDEINSNQSIKSQYNPPKKPIVDRPKLAIIIDDISTFHQAKKIKSLNLNITPSIFPPSANYPNSARVAREFEFYMIHLPLEAMNYQAQEKNTLKIGDSSAKIESEISKIRSNFPKAIYINNHTGSKFTSDYDSLKKLFIAFKKHNMIFIDSYTTKDSKAKILSSEFGNKYLKRDVFIDNTKDEKAIINKLKEAIKIAQKSGFAIAIGHPYEQTFNALKSFKSELESQVDIIFLRDLYEIYN